jgi:TonB family protein
MKLYSSKSGIENKLLITGIMSRIISTTIPIMLFLFSIDFVCYGQNGNVKSYYPDGSIESELSYINDILDGNGVWYYTNGNIKKELNYNKGVLSSWVREFYESGLLKDEYYVENGIIDGIFKSYYKNGELKDLITYSGGKQIQKKSFDYDPNYTAPLEAYKAGYVVDKERKIKNELFICNFEKCPIPVGGFKAIQENLVYPEHALRYGLEGTVTLTARISTDGDVINTKLLKGIGLGCDEAAQEAVKKTKFEPAQNEGKIVESDVTLNVEFKIQGSTYH